MWQVTCSGVAQRSALAVLMQHEKPGTREPQPEPVVRLGRLLLDGGVRLRRLLLDGGIRHEGSGRIDRPGPQVSRLFLLLRQNALLPLCVLELGLETLDHVVCFDMSQSLGKERVGASVVLRKGRPSNQDYRTYRVKSDAQDDLRMMAEVVSRWAKRQDEWPDLLLLDGGETHLSAIERTLEGMGLLGEFPIAALAKREETLFMRGIEPILLDRRGRTLVHARDEAHRFSNTFHKKRRGKGALADPLEEVEGLGAKKIQALLRHFGGRKGIEHASVRDLREVPGIGREMAERIRGHLQR